MLQKFSRIIIKLSNKSFHKINKKFNNNIKCYSFSTINKSNTNANEIKVLSYNILAREFTHYQYKYHKNGKNKCESKLQTNQRHKLCVNEIMKEYPDIALLQEVSPSFLNLNTFNEILYKNYNFYNTSGGPTLSPGTALLIKKKDIFNSIPHVIDRVHGSDKTGGGSKCSTVVILTINNNKIAFVSIHATWDGNIDKRFHHISQLEELLINKHEVKSIIIGGDFNCHYPSNNLKSLLDNSFLGQLKQVNLGLNTMTSITEERTSCIDHLFYSNNIHLINHNIEKEFPSSPYKSIIDNNDDKEIVSIQSPSDHLWIEGTFII
jgi:hypothetical protein